MGIALGAALAAPGIARAGTGPSYTTGLTSAPPAIDGTMSSGEWASAKSYSVVFGNIPATIYLERDATNLYIAAQVQDTPQGAPSLFALFDNNNNGARETGDDAWLAHTTSIGEDFVYDGGSGVSDTIFAGGSNDTVATGTVGTGVVTFEMAHPLCSTDTAHDVCMHPGTPVGIDFQYETGAPGVFWLAPGSSLTDATLWGSLTLATDVTAPSVSVTSPVAGTVLSGTVPVTATASDDVGVASVAFEFFDGATGKTFPLGTVTSPPYTIQFDTTQVPNTDKPLDATIYATATDAAGNSTKRGNGVTVSNGAAAAGSISGTMTTPATAPQDVDLTSAGGEDWAVWGTGVSTTLAPATRKANGSAISDLTRTAGALGSFSTAGGPWTFSWSDGSGPAAAGGTTAGLTGALGQTLSFTVPAGTVSRTLKVWTSAHYADGVFTATLSDGSAQPYTATLHATQGQFTNVIENVPAVVSIDYRAATAGQHLTVTWQQATNNGCQGCADAVLYAAALSATQGSASGASAALETGSFVGMSGSNDAISALPLSAFEPTPSGVTPAPIQGLPIQGLPIQGLPIQGLPIQGLPIQGLPIQGLPIQGLPIQGLPIQGLPLTEVPLTIPGGWAAALAGTSLAGAPLQTVTLQQVLALPDPKPAAIQNLTLGNLDLSVGRLGQLTIGALALGNTHVADLGLPADALASLVAWCQTSVTGCDPSTTVQSHSLFALGIAGAPIQGLPIQGLPIQGLAASASPIAALPIQGLPIQGLGLPPSVLAAFAAALTANANATLGDLPDGSLTIGQLLQILLSPGSPVKDTMTLGDLIGMLIRRDDVPWETLAPRLLSVFDPQRPTLAATLDFAIAGTGSGPATVALTLPDGFDVAQGSTLQNGDGGPVPIPYPNVSGNVATWQLPAVQFGADYHLAFALASGTDVGPAQLAAKISAGGVTAAATPASFSVTDSFQVIEGPPPEITPDTRVEQSAIPNRGAVDYYRVALPPAGTRLLVHLTNLPADYDLALYANQTTSVRTGGTAGTPLQDGIVPDEAVNLAGGPNAQLTPSALQDVPDPGIPLVQVSDNRGTDDEDVGMVSPGGPGFATIAVYGYNGASSPHPYSLRVTTQSPHTVDCGPRAFGTNAGQGTTPDALPAISSLPADLNTLILVDEKRLGDTYGSSGEATALTALRSLAGDRSLGVSGVVIPVEAVAQTQYDQWDHNACNNDAANAVANAIADEVAAVKAARPTLKYVVFAGGDDQIPFFRLPDVERIANESGFASAFGRNEYYGALAGGNLLSDNPYLDTRPIAASGRQVFIPDLVGGRLVERPDEIAGAIANFESSGGILARSSAFVSGYDFVTDGSNTIKSNLDSFLGTGATRSLISDTWSKTDLFSAAFPVGGPAAINAWNGHYDNHQALAANGDQTNLITTGDLTGTHSFSGGIFFTMGCHAGFQTTDAVVGAPVLDWAEYFAGTGTGFVGNTGFGLGNTDSVAFSEELMGDLSANLNGTLSIGEALARAKQTYYLAHVSYSAYDEKTLSEAELYGLPMYGIGHAPAAVGTPTPPAPTPRDPVTGAASSVSPNQGTLSAFPGTSVQA
ncbi:MAG TPA: Ig-like domain-containing protein, partial [Gaiellaceae bacterium]